MYSYYDYENCYYHMQYSKCIEIGKVLLSHIKDDKAKELVKELNKLNYFWDLPKEKLDNITKILEDTHILIKIYHNY